jgi:nucleoside-triphosphatase
MDQYTKNLLLTGTPGCGKTTVVLRLVGLARDLRLAGFHTQELRERGRRVGFEAVGLSSGLRCVLAHARSRSRLRVGRYGVDPDGLAPLVRAELERGPGEADAFVVDEIGKMELHSEPFVAAVRRLLEGPAPVLTTVTLKGRGLIAEVKGRADVQVLPVTAENRDRLPAAVAHWLGSPHVWPSSADGRRYRRQSSGAFLRRQKRPPSSPARGRLRIFQYGVFRRRGMAQRNLPSSSPCRFRKAVAAAPLRRFTPKAASGANSSTGHLSPWSWANFRESVSRK